MDSLILPPVPLVLGRSLDHFQHRIDLSAQSTELKSAIAISLACAGVKISVKDTLDLIELGGLHAKTIDCVVYDAFEKFIQDRIKENTPDFERIYHNMR